MPVQKRKAVQKYHTIRIQELPWEIEKEYAQKILDMLPFLEAMLTDKEERQIIN